MIVVWDELSQSIIQYLHLFWTGTGSESQTGSPGGGQRRAPHLGLLQAPAVMLLTGVPQPLQGPVSQWPPGYGPLGSTSGHQGLW